MHVVCGVISFAPRFELHASRTHKIPPKSKSNNQNGQKKSKNQIPLSSHLSHPTPKWNQNNQNPGKIPGNRKHCVGLYELEVGGDGLRCDLAFFSRCRPSTCRAAAAMPVAAGRGAPNSVHATPNGIQLVSLALWRRAFVNALS